MCQARRVLVVEDTPALRMLLQLALTDEGYEVLTAEHGAAALERIAAARPCVILLDLRMPVMDGRAFARAYRRRADADAHIIVMTANAQIGDLKEIVPSQVVTKPFDLEALLPNVEHWVAAHVSPDHRRTVGRGASAGG